MPVFTKDQKHVLYIHVPKTGGSSIEKLFRSNGYFITHYDNGTGRSISRVRRSSPQHHHASLLAEQFRLSAFDLVMMTVRDPYTRILSEYNMRRRVGEKIQPFSKWLTDVFRRLSENPGVYDNHFRPQSEFHVPGAVIFRQEDGYGLDFISKLHELIGFPVSAAVPTMNVAREEHGTESLLDKTTIEAIRHVYWKDFVQFSYSFEASSSLIISRNK